MSRNNSHRKSSRSGGRQHSKKEYPQLEGKVQMTREGFAFVIVEGMADDIFVKASKTRQALNGDRVLVAVTREKSGTHRSEGEIVRILERSTRPFIGILHTVGAQAWVLMQSKSMPYDISVDIEEAAALGATKGMKVAAVVDGWNRSDTAPHGHIVDVLGLPGENETEMHAILSEFGLPYRFSDEVENAANSISEAITSNDLKGRKDFRDTLTFTIDPADAKDYDDALSFRRLENGNFEVGVHIADVSYYVTPGSAVDKEAQYRGTSVYLVDRTVPMLPEKLCNKLCSLRPDEDKLTYSAVFEMTPKAKVVGRWIGRTIIRSNHRYNYEEVQDMIVAAATLGDCSPSGTSATLHPSQTDVWAPPVHMTTGGHGSASETVTPATLAADVSATHSDSDASSSDPQNDALTDAILTLNSLAAILRQTRFKAGAISFDRPEMKVIVDADGKPVDIKETISNESHWLIEEFMLLANRTVAEYVSTGGKMNGVVSKKAKTFVYRTHAEPNTEKVENLRKFAGTFGYEMGETGSGEQIARSLTDLLTRAKDKPEYNALQIIALRSMAKAAYTTENIGHYGLAFKFYTHFTSPIRRYPDLMVHRLLTLYLDGADSQNKGYYDEQAKHATEREILAAEAERASVKYKMIEYMQDKVGKEFDGTVSGVTEWGMYVEIDPTKVEGMVPLRTIKSDFFEFDEERYRLVGRRTRRIFTLGDKVRIRVKDTNLEQKLLDYELVEAGLPEAERPAEAPEKPKRKYSRKK